MLVNVGKPGLLGSSFRNSQFILALRCIHICCSSLDCHKEWKEIKEGDLKCISLVFSGLASLTCYVDLFSLKPGSDPLRQFTGRLALTSSRRTRDPGGLMLSKSWRNVSCCEVMGSAGRPERQRSLIPKVQRIPLILLKTCCVPWITISATFITEEAITGWGISFFSCCEES